MVRYKDDNIRSGFCFFAKGHLLCLFLLALTFFGRAQNSVRTAVSMDKGWRTIAHDKNKAAYNGFEKVSFNEQKWQSVDVPHTWDTYDGYRRMRHGNRHGYAWYRKTFSVKEQKASKRYFLFFEGVGSYATVWLNGKKVGTHAGGRTTFTIDVTHVINKDAKPNLLAVRADHPSHIKDLPWVCGGCSDERGFSEGSQPMGIFRPVHLVITDEVRIEPFGVHIWNDSTVSNRSAQLFLETEVKNYGRSSRSLTIVNRLLDKKGAVIATVQSDQQLVPGAVITVHQKFTTITRPHLWSVKDPYLYSLVTEVAEKGKVIDQITTPYGIRVISWPVGRKDSTNQFLLNGTPVFINGIAEYEHQIGKSHAFSAEQVKTRVYQMKAAGFNAFRDAHQPHNLRYQQYWDELGFLWWTQLSAHVWYNTPEFKENFKQLLTEWVKERRNSPSVVLWGLQNESKIPEDFAKECTELIRKLDPTASSQRLIVTCNGGVGTDWDVPQNWTGTYGGNPATYAEDIQRQVLIGEYGAWRTLDLHTEGPFVQNGVHSEDRMTQLMEMKVRLADSVKLKTAGHFMWLFASHDNPGRVQGGEGYRELDRIGPVNYKGLLTPWEEPLDVFYMYRANYAPKEKEPMAYIVSHTWPDRWTTPGKKEGITVYSNCDEVELFNDVDHLSLGRKKKGVVGTHFQWDGVDIRYNVLYAVGYVNGKAVAKDYVVLHHLPKPPHFSVFLKEAKNLTAPKAGYNYLYRVNCGGGDYKDENGQLWMADRRKSSSNTWGSLSWTEDFPGLPPFMASQRQTADPIKGTREWALFQSFRYGREKLRFEFPVPDGEYLVELYFIEPWLGTGCGMDCTGWRLFDVAVNGKTVLKDVDLWKEAGHDAAIKKTVVAKVTGGQLQISFPRVASGQAVISAIAIATANPSVRPVPASPALIQSLKVNDKANSGSWSIHEWLATGTVQYSDNSIRFRSLPPNLYGAAWISMPSKTKATKLAQFTVAEEADVFIGMDERIQQRPEWLQTYEDTKTSIENSKGERFTVYRKRYAKNAVVNLGANGAADKEINGYTVAVVPVSHIEPAYDLKPATNYKAVNARLSGPGIGKGIVDGKERVVFKKVSPDNLIEWDIAVGVADTYSLTITYNNPHTKAIRGKLELLAADGTLMKEESVELTTTRPGKSNYINGSTGSMINAGNYKVRLRAEEAEGVSVNALDVQ
jgi:beta-galactosidase